MCTPCGPETKSALSALIQRLSEDRYPGIGVASDGGLILVLEWDERLGSSEFIEQHPPNSRRGKNTQFPLVDLPRQSVYTRLAGYEDMNDAERYHIGPARMAWMDGNIANPALTATTPDR